MARTLSQYTPAELEARRRQFARRRRRDQLRASVEENQAEEEERQESKYNAPEEKKRAPFANRLVRLHRRNGLFDDAAGESGVASSAQLRDQEVKGNDAEREKQLLQVLSDKLDEQKNTRAIEEKAFDYGGYNNFKRMVLNQAKKHLRNKWNNTEKNSMRQRRQTAGLSAIVRKKWRKNNRGDPYREVPNCRRKP